MIDKATKSLKIFRDDLYPFLGGGNKGRKMNEIAKAIFNNKAKAIVTTGGFQSNHCRATAIFAAQHHLACTLVLHGSGKEFQKQSGNAKIMRLSGAEIVFVEEANQIGPAMDKAMENYENKNLKPYYLWGGGHTLEGGLAYIKAVQELKEYSIQNNWLPDYIFLASGTGSTQAGILAGLDKYQINSKVIGISVGRQQERAETVVKEFYQELKQHYEISEKDRQVIVLDEYLCGGYGLFNKEIEKIAKNSIQEYGFTLDTCYTAKAFYGMQDYINKNNLSHKNILFWHTGGIFNFLAEEL